MIDFLQLPWAQRLIYALGGLVLGLLVEIVVVKRVRRFAEQTRFTWDDLLLKALRGVPTIWIACAAIYLAINVGDLDPGIISRSVTVLEVIAIGAAVVAGMRLAGGAVESLSAGATESSPTLVVNLAKIAVAILGGFIILQNLGIEITPLITALGIGGLAVALALQDTLGNLFAGVQIILSRAVKPHDYIQLSTGEAGWVSDVRARHTTIETFPDGNLLTVPNSVLASSIVKNFSYPDLAMWVSVPVGVSYSSDLAKVEQVTLEVARTVVAEVEGGLADPEPFVLYKGFGDFSIDFDVRMRVRDFRSQGLIRHEFIKRLHRRYEVEGIEIPFPIRTVIMKSGEPSAG
jgi:small-conductance mechanosensitive channel